MPEACAVTPRLAASVIVLRRADPFEVLVVKRRGGRAPRLNTAAAASFQAIEAATGKPNTEPTSPAW